MNPEQAAERSMPYARVAPIFAWRKHAVDGNGMSGVSVPTTTISRSAGSTPASSSAIRAALSQRSEFAVPGSAMCRTLIPVRSVIQLSLVSTIFSRSRLANSFGGAYIPSPTIFDANGSPPLVIALPFRRRVHGGVSPRRDGPGDFDVHTAARKGPGGPDPVLDRPLAGRSVTDEDPAPHPQKRSATVLLVIQPVLHSAKSALREQGAHLRHEGLPDLLFQELAKRRRHPLHRLDRDVSDEPVADEDVGFPGEEVPPLHVPDEIQSRAAEQLARLPREIRPLRILLADADDTDAWPGDPEDRPGVRLAHVPELQKMGRLAVDVRAGVNEDHRTVGGGDGRRDRRAVHTVDLLEDQEPPRHHRPGVSRADEGGCLSVGDQAKTDANRGVPFLPESNGRDFAHLHDFGGVQHLDIGTGNVDVAQFRADPLFPADQDQGEAVGTGRLHRPAHDLPRGVVPPHRIDGDFHRMEEGVSLRFWR